ncbi:hypothetical protein [Sphingobacterium faecium]|nr:hypothetical protein [Sphingobacterium faecium]MDH5825960.1 hypothetical protein [Sphingobacterium faecium]
MRRKLLFALSSLLLKTTFQDASLQLMAIKMNLIGSILYVEI